MRRIGTAVLVTSLLGLGASTAAARVPAGERSVIRVPADAPTIQEAVDRASPGTLVLVAPGIYREGVTVAPEHKNIVIRGESRTGTILDGEFSEEVGRENGFKVFADGVAIENITARNFAVNGFFWSGVIGYRGSYLTAVRNGDYGIYAFDSVNGQFDHSYASGSPDAGFYIGQCSKCRALIVDVESEWNGLGYSGTNAGGDLVIARSSWHDNRGGIAPNSLTSEELYPQRGVTIVGNHVFDNNNGATPAIEIAEISTGNGVLVAGGRENLVARNLVTDHIVSGIALIPLPETLLGDSDDDDYESLIDFEARDNTVRDNVTQGNRFDLAVLTSIDDEADPGGNCFAGNEFSSSLPADVEAGLPCGKPAADDFSSDLATFASLLLAPQPPSADYRTVPLPPTDDLPSMPNAKTAKARPARNEPSIRVDPKKVKTPTG